MRNLEAYGGIRVTVVMPTYNEAANLPRTAEAVLGLPLDGPHLKIVDGSSPDGTGRIAEELAEKYNWDGRWRMSVLHRTEKDVIASLAPSLAAQSSVFAPESQAWPLAIS
jgi:dolichol-phosphate mannosyltransferase